VTAFTSTLRARSPYGDATRLPAKFVHLDMDRCRIPNKGVEAGSGTARRKPNVAPLSFPDGPNHSAGIRPRRACSPARFQRAYLKRGTRRSCRRFMREGSLECVSATAGGARCVWSNTMVLLVDMGPPTASPLRRRRVFAHVSRWLSRRDPQSSRKPFSSARRPPSEVLSWMRMSVVSFGAVTSCEPVW
jgi:hypothetical protein